MNNFTFFANYKEFIDDLPKEKQGEFALAVIEYGTGGKEPNFTDPLMKMAWKGVRYPLEISRTKSKAKQGKTGNKSDGKSEENQNEIKPQSNQNQNEIKTETNEMKCNESEMKGNENNLSATATPQSLELSNAGAVPVLNANQPNSMSDIISSRLGVALPTKHGGAFHEWQDFAKRFADGLKIELTASENPSWFKIFGQAEKDGRRRILEQAYSYLVDSSTFARYDNARKLSSIYFIFHHGLDAYKQKGASL